MRWRLDVHLLTPDLLSTEPIVGLAAWVVSPPTTDGQRPVTTDVRAFHEAWDRLRPDLAVCLTNAVRTTPGWLTLIYPPASTAVT